MKIGNQIDFALAISGCVACNSMIFELEDPTGRVQEVQERKDYFFWGLTPTRTVDVREHCPDGVASIEEATLAEDALLSLVTLGIYSPRSSTYYCREKN